MHLLLELLGRRLCSCDQGRNNTTNRKRRNATETGNKEHADTRSLKIDFAQISLATRPKKLSLPDLGGAVAPPVHTPMGSSQVAVLFFYRKLLNVC